MTHFVRFAMIGAMVAGASVCALAQDDDFDALLEGLIDEPAVEQPQKPEEGKDAKPAEEADKPADEAPAEKDAKAEEPAKEEPIADEPAAEPAKEEPKVEEPKAEPEAEEPAKDEPAKEEPVAEPAKEEPKAEEPAAEDSDASEGGADAEAGEADPLLGSVAQQPIPDVLGEEERKLNELATLEKVRQEGLDKHAYACLEKGQQLLKAAPAPGRAFDQYKEAIKMFSDAKRYARQREANLPLRTECDVGIREARYLQARTLFMDRDFKKALELAQQVQKEGHPLGEQLVAQIQEEMNRPADIRPNPVLPEYATDAYKTKRVQIAERLRRATVYFQIANYEEATNQIELILRDDPNNEAAINLRNRIGNRAASRENDLKLATHAVMINDVNKNWTPRGALGMNSTELYDPTATSSGQPVPVGPTAGEKEAQVVMAKLNYIRLPEFSIRPPSTLADAVQMFAEMSKAYDKPELPPEEKGIAFVLNMGSNTKAAEPAAEADPFATEASPSSGGLPPIQNISMPWVTLKEALDMVCEVTGSKYVIKGKTVVIVPASYVDGKMETRSYNVMSSIVEKVNQVGGELSAGSSMGGSDGGWGMETSSMDTGSSASADTWKQLFTDLGVPFEGKASIVYLPSVGKLRVTNTPENLALFENILEELNVTPYQIEVEARFVEVSQADLNSLGFEWQLNNNIVGTIGSGIDWASSAMGGREVAGGVGSDGTHVFRASDVGGTGKSNIAMHGGSLNQGMRFLGDGSTYANRINLSESAIAPNDEFATFSFVFGKVDMTMILHMLAQRTDTDMLSSPKVLARPGQEALIRVVTEWIYPTEFDVTELEEADNNYDNNNTSVVGGGGVQVTAPPVKFAVEPQSFEKQDVGVSLQVVPEVSQEGQMINLLVNPKVVEYLGDFEYGMQVPYVQYGMTAGQVTSAEVQYYQVSMPQPKFHFREISTYLSVYNGSTVVMGGLITEQRNSFEDKVPFLGDLPFIGFLFRSRGEYSEKRNLLIFLTARLVDPAGRPLKTATDGRTGDAAIDRGAPAGTMATTAQ